MIVLSLDQALVTTGWAIYKNDKLYKYGTFSIKKTLPIEQRLYQIQKEILEIIFDNCGDDEPDRIVFEGIQNQQNNETYKKLAYTQAAIMLLCYESGMEYSIYSPSEWRKILGGGFGKKREEQKEAAIKYVKDNFNVDVDSDTADAICIGAAYLKNKIFDKKESAF